MIINDPRLKLFLTKCKTLTGLNKTKNPVSGYALIQSNDGHRVTLTATNLNSTLSMTIIPDVIDHGLPVLIPIAESLKLCKKHGLTIESKNSKPIINGVTFQNVPTDYQWPELPQKGHHEQIGLLDLNAIKKITKVVPFVEKDKKDYRHDTLSNVALTFDYDSQCKMVATNGHYLTKTEFKMSCKIDFNPPQILIPAKPLELFCALKLNEPVAIYLRQGVNKNLVWLCDDTFDLCVTLHNGSYPAWNEVLNRFCVYTQYQIVCNTRQWIEILSEFKALSDKDSKLIKFSNGVLSKHDSKTGISLSKKVETLKNSHTESLDNIEFGFNGDYLLNFLKTFKDDECFSIQSKNFGPEPLVFHKDSQVFVLMPMRLLE